jgi:hypothetical protein
VYRDPGGLYVYLVAVRLRVAALPYLTAGVSSFPGPIVEGCNLWSGRSVLRSTPGGTLFSRGPYKTHHGHVYQQRAAAGALYYWRPRGTASLPSLRASMLPSNE